MKSCWCRRKSTREIEDDFRRKSIKLREGPFLHGELEVEIREARNLPDTDNFMFNIKNCFGQEKDVTDPYVAVSLGSTRIITTSVSFTKSISYGLLHNTYAYVFMGHVCIGLVLTRV